MWLQLRALADWTRALLHPPAAPVPPAVAAALQARLQAGAAALGSGLVVGAGGMWWLGVRLPHSAHLWALMNLAAPRTDAPALAALAEHQVAAARRVTSLCEIRHVPLRCETRPSENADARCPVATASESAGVAVKADCGQIRVTVRASSSRVWKRPAAACTRCSHPQRLHPQRCSNSLLSHHQRSGPNHSAAACVGLGRQLLPRSFCH